MTRRFGFLSSLLTCAVLLLAFAAPALAAPEWQIDALSDPTAAPGGQIEYAVQIANYGDAPAPQVVAGDANNCAAGAVPPSDPANCYRIVASFPPGLTPVSATKISQGSNCTVGAETITCTVSGHAANQQLQPRLGNATRSITVKAAVAPGTLGQTLTATFEASGAGATPDTVKDATRIDDQPLAFGLAELDNQLTANPAGDPSTQAGAHPFEQALQIQFETSFNPSPVKGPFWPVEATKDIVVDLPPGFVGDLSELDRCSEAELSSGGLNSITTCPSGAQVGLVFLRYGNFTRLIRRPLFNMEPPPGAPARFGFNALGTTVVLDAKLRSHSDYGLSMISRSTSQGLAVQGADVTLWGVPSAAAHDRDRACPDEPLPLEGAKFCTSGVAETPILRNPTSCTPAGEGLPTTVHADSWDNPAAFGPEGLPDLDDPNWDSKTVVSHEPPGFPAAPGEWGAPHGPDNCDDVPVEGELEAEPTTRDAESGSGLTVHVEVPNPGMENPAGIASSDIKRVKVTLPQGLTINPSQAEGLGVCSPAEYESTELSFYPSDKGCPSDSKIGTVEVVTPLLEEKIPGSVYVAEPYDNPFDTLLAIYVVLEEPERGILVRLPAKVETDGTSGRIVTTFDDLPQLPFSTFDFKFREGARAPLVTPPTCGTYTTETEITGWSSVDPVTGQVDPEDIVHSKSSFVIDRGIGGGPCPPAAPGFDPGFEAGSINNNAGSFSRFVMRLTRKDGDQDLTKFSSVLPPGVSAKIAGVERCSDLALAAAAGRSGREELASPSCSTSSRIGRTMVGAGVGSVLTYVPGSIYLAGPYKGAPLSVAAITPAVAGPFDVGTVVVRQALNLDPKTAEVRVDGSASDPIPHILEGIPLKLRDLRVYVDRESFTINPTSCDPSQVAATLFGSGLDVFSPADDQPAARAAHYQAANCSSLGFRPRLRINLKGGTRRSKFPALRAELNTLPGDANIGKVRVTLPDSEFLAQAHIGTTCTRVQFAAAGGNGRGCPANSVYGWARAWTPLLDEPLEGPVFLRSNGGERELPDLVAALRGIVDVELEGWIDTGKGGGIRTTFQSVPDAPVSKFVLSMRGGKKGLLENSTNICHGRHRATVAMDGQNGKVRDFRPLLKALCRKKGGKGRR